MFPEKYRWIIDWNPMGTIITSYRDIFFYKRLPDLSRLGLVAIFSFIIFYVGLAVFKKLQKGFAEEV